MVTQIPKRTDPKPNTGNLTAEQFNDSMNRWFQESPVIEQALGQLGMEVEALALNVEAAAGASVSSKWVAGTFAQGDERWSPTDFLNYRCKVAGVRNIDPAIDPTNWQLLTKTSLGGSDTVSSATDIALIVTSGRLQIIAMTTANKNVVLPVASTLNKGAPIYVIKNAGTYRFAVRKNGGEFLCWVNPGQTIAFGCSDITTAAGVWAVSGAAGNIYDGNAPEVLNGVDSRDLAVAMLTPTKAVCAFKNNSTAFLEAVVVNYGSASGTPVPISSEAVRNISIAAQASNQVTVVYQQVSNSNIRGYVLDITGNTPTPGPVATIHTAGIGTPEGTGITALTATKLLCIYNAGAVQVKERVLDLSGNTINSISTEVNADLSSSSYIYLRAGTISPTKALVSFLGTSGQVVIRLQSITGSTPAPTGTVLAITSPGAIVKSAFAVCIMSAIRAVVIKPIDRDYGGLAVYIVDISGATPTLITGKQIPIDLPIGNTHVSAARLDSNRIHVTWAGGLSQGIDALVLTITSDDRIIPGEISDRLEPGVTSANGYLACDALDSSHVIQVCRNANTFLSAKTIEIA